MMKALYESFWDEADDLTHCANRFQVLAFLGQLTYQKDYNDLAFLRQNDKYFS